VQLRPRRDTSASGFDCEQASWFGFQIDEGRNAAGGPRITVEGGKASAWVIPTDEDLIARHTWALAQQLGA